MIHLDSVAALRAQSKEWRAAGDLGFVPTMGALHEGHLSLVRAARERCPRVVASVFVNPTQFGPGEDLDRYPSDLEGDRAKLASAGCDALFTTTKAEMYPEGYATWVDVEGPLTQGLCGAKRPGHFRGVTTVVLKLLGLVNPTHAFFGEKDRQQLIVLQRMATDLNLPYQIHGCPIVREPSGLALSSRNAYLDAGQRRRGLALSQGLRAAQSAFAAGETGARALEAIVRAELVRHEVDEDYIHAVSPLDLAPVATADASTIVAVAAHLGSTRLIDNCVLSEALPTPKA
jgi:pantoate--beta-alanine ligase